MARIAFIMPFILGSLLSCQDQGATPPKSAARTPNVLNEKDSKQKPSTTSDTAQKDKKKEDTSKEPSKEPVKDTNEEQVEEERKTTIIDEKVEIIIPGVKKPLPPKVLCTFSAKCSGSQFTLVSDCEGQEKGTSSVSPMPECAQVAAALDGLGLPTGKTTEMLEGGGNLNASCKDTTLSMIAIGPGTEASFGLKLPAKVCLEFRNIINGLQI